MTGVATKIARAFGGLKVRYKLMVLHNVYFLILAPAIYFSVVPPLEDWAQRAQAREILLRSALHFGESVPFRPPHPNVHDLLVGRLRLTLLLVLGASYWLGVVVLELFVMRLYIYRPLRTMLDADEASRRGDTAREMVGEALIQGDELGRLIRSRNETLGKLRQHEKELESALRQLEEAAAALQRKNELLETAKRKIADQDRLASLGLLSASVAHELNTPLAVLRGSIEQLREAPPDQFTAERLDRMLRVTDRLQKISEGMVDFARVRTRDETPVSVHSVVEEAWNLVAIEDKSAAVEFRNDADPDHLVLGNADRLVQLFVNLVRNALHAVHEGGRIRVHSRAEESAEGGLVITSVDDNGPGFPADVLPEVFEAFITTRLDARGTGLGLTVAEGIAHQHGGSITASNREEGGARLEVLLPAAVPASGRKEHA